MRDMRQRFGLWMLSIPLLVACAPEDEAVSGQTLALTAQGNVERALRGLYDAGSFVADSASLADILSPIVSGESCDAVSPTCPVGQVCPVETDCEPSEITVADLQDGREDVNEAIDELVTTLREKVFIPANLESEDAESATYLLGANVLCQNDDSASTPLAPGEAPPPAGDGAPDPECVEEAQKLQIRLRLTAPSDGDVDVELLLSASRRNPATLELHDDHVGVVVDLGEVKATLDAIGEDTGEIEALSGTLALEIFRYAALDYGLRFSVRTPLHVGLVHEDGQPIDVNLAASVPTTELRLDGNARQVTGSYNLGALGVIAPLDAFRDSDEDPVAPADPNPGAPTPTPQPEPVDLPWTGTIDAFLAGIDGSVTLDGSADELAFVNLGFGDASSTVKHDGTLIAQLDVNPEAGRHFDLNIAQPGDADPTLTFSPTFDLRVLLNFASLASQLEDLPGYALSDSLRVFFDGSEPAIRELSASDQLQVVSGTLNLTSTSMPASNLVVPAGSCLVEVESDSPVAHELLGQFAVSNCQ